MVEQKRENVFDKKPVFLMSTSLGPGAGANHFKYLIHSLPYQDAEIAASYSLPPFHNNVQGGKVTGDYLGQLKESISEFREVVNG